MDVDKIVEMIYIKIKIAILHISSVVLIYSTKFGQKILKVLKKFSDLLSVLNILLACISELLYNFLFNTSGGKSMLAISARVIQNPMNFVIYVYHNTLEFE